MEKLTPEVFISCVSELREIHGKVHGNLNMEEIISQLDTVKSGKSIGCPICDIGASILLSEQMCNEFNDLNQVLLGPTVAVMALLGMEGIVVTDQAGILVLGIMIGRKQKEIELMKIEHHC